MCPVDQELRPVRGDRIIQIPLEWPLRYGTVADVNADDPPTAFRISWDDGREEWIREEDFVARRIWFIRDDAAPS